MRHFEIILISKLTCLHCYSLHLLNLGVTPANWLIISYNSVEMILGIETSCDETAAGVVDPDGTLLSNVVASQAELHSRYGGIVPEMASRRHIYDIAPVVFQALSDANAEWRDLDAIAVTNGPGLAGSLMIGVNFAKGAAAATQKPLIAVNHLVGHVMAAFISDPNVDRATDADLGNIEDEPIMCLIVSGGHTELVICHRSKGDGYQFNLIGETRDDAAGEAFDKAARAIGLQYPGGPEIQRAADKCKASVEPLPRAWLGGSLEFSFSGLKTAVINRARDAGIYHSSPSSTIRDHEDDETVSSIAKAFQDSVVDVLVSKTVKAALSYECSAIALVGGVAANSALRTAMRDKSPVPVAVPPIALCTDNGAMIARAGLESFRLGIFSDFDLDVIPSLRIG